jgi:hypothetical protein
MTLAFHGEVVVEIFFLFVFFVFIIIAALVIAAIRERKRRP